MLSSFRSYSILELDLMSDCPYHERMLGICEYVVEGCHQPRFAGFLTRQTDWGPCGSSRGPDSSLKRLLIFIYARLQTQGQSLNSVFSSPLLYQFVKYIYVS